MHNQHYGGNMTTLTGVAGIAEASGKQTPAGELTLLARFAKNQQITQLTSSV